MTDGSTVVVVGGGLAGLVAARHLAEGGVDVRLVEREPVFGGRVRSTHEDGFTFDRGFQVLFTSYPTVERELDASALDFRTFNPGAVLCRPGKRSVLADPLRDPSALTNALFNREITFRDKLKILSLRRELSGKTRQELFSGSDTTIRQSLEQRGFSEQFIANFIAPFYGGVTLDRTLSASKRTFEYTFKCLAEGSAAVPAQGMGAVPEYLAERARDAGAVLIPNTTVEQVEATDGSATVELPDGEVYDPDAVVVATDPPTATDLTGVESIPTSGRGCVTLYYGLPGGAGLDAGKRILLNLEDGEPNQIVPHSAVASEYAPPGRELISATFLGDRDEPVARLDDTVRRTLGSWYPEREFSGLELLHVDQIPFAQFDQPPGCHDELPSVSEPEGRCYLAGEYTAWSSLSGAMESGRDAARTVIGDIS